MHPILKRIERHLRVTGEYPSRFGRLAIKDPRLVTDLKKGRMPGAATIARLEAFIRAQETGA